MRKLQTSDVFALARIIRASGIRSELKEIIDNAMKSENFDVRDIGMDGIIATIEAAAEKGTEDAVYNALAPIFEIKPKEIATMPPMEFVKKLEELVEDNDVKSFFSYVSGILGRN